MEFQSSFELTGYITTSDLYTTADLVRFQSSFELTGYITYWSWNWSISRYWCFKALSSLRVI